MEDQKYIEIQLIFPWPAKLFRFLLWFVGLRINAVKSKPGRLERRMLVNDKNAFRAGPVFIDGMPYRFLSNSFMSLEVDVQLAVDDVWGDVPHIPTEIATRSR